MKENIFKVGVEVTGESLIGYQRHIDYIVGSFLNNKRNLSVTGVKRIGKTSLAKEAMRIIKNKEKDKFIIVEVDLARCEDYLSFLKTLLNKTKHEVKHDFLLLERKEIEELIVQCYNCIGDKFMLQNSLEELFEEINSYEKRIIIMIDEFDAATNIFTSTPDFEFLRNLSSNSDLNISLLLISRRQIYMIEKRNSNNSTFHGIITSYPINGFNKEDMNQFFDKLYQNYVIEIPTELKARIAYYAGRSPYIWSMFGSAIVENFDSENGLDIDDLFKKHFVDMKDHYKAIYDNLSTDMIYTEGKPVTDTTIDKLVEILYGPNIDIKPADIEILKELGYLDVDDYGRYYAVSAYFTDFIRGKVTKLKGSFFENIIQTERCVKNIISIEMPKLCEKYMICDASMNDCQKKLLIITGIASDRKIMQHDISIESNRRLFNQESTYLDVMSLKDSFKMIMCNWEDVFSKYFDGMELDGWEEIFEKCAKARNPVAHGHEEFLSNEERKMTEKYCIEILNHLSGYLNRE